MGKKIKSSIIIYDDFKNVLIVQKGKSKNFEPKVWTILNKDITEKQDPEKYITKSVGKDLKCNIFDLLPFKVYEEGENKNIVFSGKLKEQIVCSADINEFSWIKEKNLNEYTFSDLEEKILLEFFKTM